MKRPSPPPPRRLRTLLLFLLLLVAGAAVNVAVAWGVAYSGRPWLSTKVRGEVRVDSNGFLVEASVVRWRGYWEVRYEHLGLTKMWPDPYRTTFPRLQVDDLPSWCLVHDARLPDLVLDRWIWDRGTGWPALSLRNRAIIDLRTMRVEILGGIGVDRPKAVGIVTYDALPCIPIWPGFAINTIFYAAILWVSWLLFAAPFAVRRRRRVKRNLCPACAYPVGTSDLCTECGKPVTAPSLRPAAPG